MGNDRLSSIGSYFNSFQKFIDSRKLDNGYNIDLLNYDLDLDLTLIGALKTLIPSLKLGGFERLFEVLVIVKTPNLFVFPIIFHFGPSGLAFDSWHSKKVDILREIFTDGFDPSLVVNPFSLKEDSIRILQKIFIESFRRIPYSNYKFIYRNDQGRFIISYNNQKFSIKLIKEPLITQFITSSRKRKYPPEVSCVSFSPKNDFLLTGFWDGSIYAYDINKEKFIKGFFGHDGIITSLEFLAENSFVSGACDPIINYWDYSNQSLVKSCRSTKDHSSTHSLVKFQNKFLIVGFFDNEESENQWIEIWNIQLNKLSGVIKHSRIFENFIIWGNNLIGCYDFLRIGIFNIKKQMFTSVIDGHKGYIRCVNYLPKRNLIVSGSDDGSTRIWNSINLKHISTIAGGAEHLIFTDDEEYIIRSIYDKISIINCNNLQETKNIRLSSYITDITISSDNMFIVASTRNSIKILDFATLGIVSDIDTTKPKVLQ
jgi:WD40 repeat protein